MRGAFGRIVDAAGLVALVATLLYLPHWREARLRAEGFGLQATYYRQPRWQGTPLGRAVEPHLDHGLLRSVQAGEAASLELEGTLVLPHSGEHSFVLRGRGVAALSIDGQVIATVGARLANDSDRQDAAENTGKTGAAAPAGGALTPAEARATRRLERGKHALLLRYDRDGGPPGLELSWVPAGQAHERPLPASLLFPEPPDRVDARRAHDAIPDDRTAVAVLLLALAAVSLVAARGAVGRWVARLRADAAARVDLLLFLLVLGLALAVRLADLPGAGETGGETRLLVAGERFWHNLLVGDLRPGSWAVAGEHPALAKWVYGAASLLGGGLAAGRATSALLGALGCALLCVAGRQLLGSRWVGALAGGLAIVLPPLVAHGRIVGLEALSALLYLLAVLVFHRALIATSSELVDEAIRGDSRRSGGRSGNSGYHLCAGLCAGLAIAVQLLNATVLLVLLAMYLVAHWQIVRQQHRLEVSLTMALVPLCAASPLLLLWPYLWTDLPAHLGALLNSFSELGDARELFLGQVQRPPPAYLVVHLAVGVPVGLLLATLVGVVAAASRRSPGRLALLAWFLAPLLASLLTSAVAGGTRAAAPALLAACLLAALGVDAVSQGLARATRASRHAAPASVLLGAALAVYALHAALAMHPYYLDYYNEAVGGPAGVARSRTFPVGWGGEGLAEATAYVARKAPRGATVAVDADPADVVRLPSGLRRVAVAAEPDFVIHNRLRRPPLSRAGYRPAFVVRVAGAPLAWVFEREDRSGSVDEW